MREAEIRVTQGGATNQAMWAASRSWKKQVNGFSPKRLDLKCYHNKKRNENSPPRVSRKEHGPTDTLTVPQVIV